MFEETVNPNPCCVGQGIYRDDHWSRDLRCGERESKECFPLTWVVRAQTSDTSRSYFLRTPNLHSPPKLTLSLFCLINWTVIKQNLFYLRYLYSKGRSRIESKHRRGRQGQPLRSPRMFNCSTSVVNGYRGSY